jgi:peptidoglycan/LPS O-acetylase OafA/YrhL
VIQSKPRSHRIPSLDGLRGISIWAVILAHAFSHFQRNPPSGHVLRSGLHLLRSGLWQLAYFGVTVFFVISGFLITSLLVREYTRSSRIDLRHFYHRRAIRILPASLVYIGIILALGSATRSQSVYALTFTTSFFFAHAYGPLQQLWSLSVEEQFYLLWPLVFLLGERCAKRCGWTVMIFCPIFRLFLKHGGYPEIEHLAPAIADSIGAGCLLALYYDKVRAIVSRYFVSGVGFAFLCFASLATSELVFRYNAVTLWGIVPCTIALIISAAIERRDRILNSGPIVWSGLLSYSLYLWQQPFLVLDGPLNFLSVRIVAAIVAAYVSYRFVEQSALSVLKPRGRAELASTPAPPLTYAQPERKGLRGAAAEAQ